MSSQLLYAEVILKLLELQSFPSLPYVVKLAQKYNLQRT